MRNQEHIKAIQAKIFSSKRVICYALMFLCVMCFFSCEKSIDYQIENQKSRVVVYAFPMPDSTFQIHVSNTTDILSQKEFEEIDHVAIQYRVNSESLITTNYPKGEEWYSIGDANLQSKDTVNLQLNVNDSVVVAAQTIIPEPIQILMVDTLRVLEYNEDDVEEEMLKCDLSIFDPAGVNNFYQIRVDSYTITEENGIENRTIETVDILEKDKVFISQDYEATLLAEIDYQSSFDDYLINGQYYAISFSIPNRYILNAGIEEKRVLHFYLYSLSPEYYKYIRSVSEQEAFREDPFYEQSNVYTNITNGLGVVAGLAMDVDSLTIFDNLK
ncbi:DUF4249 domain-containing protein [Plebeiibacterium sediminum]|uniref:DUF4249 domain-containing protein n=1 Tax=Plebeiibacterium sediminum TaxID=2992112 RepID=A0AAE3M5Z6_9BACT|nr:DUF4249 domain-containing protein [Plebeiobacterium sediminum]MCW3787240.1 DUF4249 domain-containing protein [Plebeiobacterium sediminum]